MSFIWKDIKWYAWLYKAGNLGDIKHNWKRLKPILMKSWYLRVSLSKNWIVKHHLVHRLIAETFILNPENKPEVNHKFGIKDDNRITELEWATKKENHKHRFEVLGHKTNFHTNHPNKWKFWILHNRSRKINQYSLDWIFIKEWNSITEAWVMLRIKLSWISQCINLKQNTSWWFKWKLSTD